MCVREKREEERRREKKSRERKKGDERVLEQCQFHDRQHSHHQKRKREKEKKRKREKETKRQRNEETKKRRNEDTIATQHATRNTQPNLLEQHLCNEHHQLILVVLDQENLI